MTHATNVCRPNSEGRDGFLCVLTVEESDPGTHSGGRMTSLRKYGGAFSSKVRRKKWIPD